MLAVNRRFAEIINGNKQFIIPVFQRDYSWTTTQCLQLWQDVLRASSKESASHFMGSFVYVEGTAGAAFSTWLVIDGQQRLSTLTLLLIALRDHIGETGWVGGEDSPSTDQIDAYFLRNIYEKDNRSYKLILRRADNSTLRSLIDGEDLLDSSDTSEPVVEAYDLFRELLAGSESDPDAVYKGIGCLEIVDVKLDYRDNPQLVFESLNSTGVDLSESDLIRNYLLMGLKEEEQTKLYNDHWSKIEHNFRQAGNAPDSFLRDYIALKQKLTTQSKADQIYEDFKKFWQLSDVDSTAVILEDMGRFARYYVAFLRPSMTPHKPIFPYMVHVRSGGFGNTHAPLVMRLYDYYDRNLVTQADFIRALRLIKSYLIRRAVLGLQTRDYWSVFARMAHSIKEDSVFESFQVVLARQNYSYRFPSDREFITGLQECNLYRLRICRHILERLENYGEREPSPIQEYSVEHILPQQIQDVPEWQEMLGADWEEVHETWLHRLGNLTLTAYNSTYSNRPFLQKKTIQGGFNQSAVRLNQYVREQEQWTAAEMEERGRLLANRAIAIWPNHQADEGLILDEEIRELRGRAAQKDSGSIAMTPQVRNLLTSLQGFVHELGDVIEVIEYRSVCFYDSFADFFVEMLPMAYQVRILVPLDFDEVDDPEEIAMDVTDYKFLPNVIHSYCGVFLDVKEQWQITAAMQIVRQAFIRSEE
ncbi:MAG: DUF262 domain-containing protein [Chloroflexi bacterium]|nr:DUF262 domain-containing protein [Chloroflexota bacterium]